MDIDKEGSHLVWTMGLFFGFAVQQVYSLFYCCIVNLAQRISQKNMSFFDLNVTKCKA